MSSSQPTGDTTHSRRSLVRTSVIATFLGVLGVLYGPFLFAGLALIATALCAVRCLLAIPARMRPDLRRRITATVIYGAVTTITLGVGKLYDEIARQRRETMLSAIGAFHERHGRLPGRLSELVPEFIDALPRATPKPMGANQYIYHPGADELHLCYPSGVWLVMACYDSSKLQWTLRD